MRVCVGVVVWVWKRTCCKKWDRNARERAWEKQQPITPPTSPNTKNTYRRGNRSAFPVGALRSGSSMKTTNEKCVSPPPISGREPRNGAIFLGTGQKKYRGMGLQRTFAGWPNPRVTEV